MTAKSTPSYLRQKHMNRPDRAFVEIGGQRHYLGRWDDPDSLQRYHRVVQQWKTTGCPPVLSDVENGLTITGLCARFWIHAQAEYPQESAANFRPALRSLRALYGVGSNPITRFRRKTRRILVRAGRYRIHAGHERPASALSASAFLDVSAGICLRIDSLPD